MSESILVEALDDSIIVTIEDTDGVHEMTIAQAIGFRAELDEALSKAQAVRANLAFERAQAIRKEIASLTEELQVLGVVADPTPAPIITPEKVQTTPSGTVLTPNIPSAPPRVRQPRDEIIY